MNGLDPRVARLLAACVAEHRAVLGPVASRDRLTLGVPYCGVLLTVEFVFDVARVPLPAPDVVLHPSTESGLWPNGADAPDPPPDWLLLPAAAASAESAGGALAARLLAWDARDAGALCHVIGSLRDAFAARHARRLADSGDDRVGFEFGTMAHGLESMIHGPSARFLAPVRLDHGLESMVESPLAAASASESPPPSAAAAIAAEAAAPRPSARLAVSFPLGGAAGGTARLDMPESWRHLLTPAPLPKLPPWGVDSCLIEYLPVVTAAVAAALATPAAARVARCRFFFALGTALADAPQPGDPPPVWWDGVKGLGCGFVVALGGEAGTEAMTEAETEAETRGGAPRAFLDVRLTTAFPNDLPRFTLTPLPATDAPGPKPGATAGVGGVYTRFPWSPRWSPTEMAQRAASFLRAEARAAAAAAAAAAPAGDSEGWGEE